MNKKLFSKIADELNWCDSSRITINKEDLTKLLTLAATYEAVLEHKELIKS